MLLLLIYRQYTGSRDWRTACDVQHRPRKKEIVQDEVVKAIMHALESTPMPDLRRFVLNRDGYPTAAEHREARGCVLPSPVPVSEWHIRRHLGARLRRSRSGSSSRYPAACPTICAGPGRPTSSFARLADLLDNRDAPRPSLLLLLGNQVYIDETAGLFDPSLRDGLFRAPYERWLSSPCVHEVLCRLPVECGLDDHEIRDRWEPDDPPISAGGDEDKGAQ